MNTLDQIAVKHGTDKATSHPIVRDGRGHGYAPYYDQFFTPLRESPIKFLEIGVGGAESIKTWLEYFTHPDTRIFGIDLVNTTNPFNTVGEKPDPRYTFATGDQSDDAFWTSFIAERGLDWDVILDDGGHSSQQIITTFKHLWPTVRAGGLYCIEDLNCAYAGTSDFCPEGWQNHMDFIKDMLDAINREQREIKSLHYSCELAIIQKV